MIELFEEENYLAFIRRYCQRHTGKKGRIPLTNAETINEHWNRLLIDYNNVNQDAIKDYLNKIEYNSIYLTTYWWYIIKHKKKLMDGFVCTNKNCLKDSQSLSVHHKTYDHKGEEIKFMDSIVTLCQPCHNEEHELERHKENTKQNKKNTEVVLTKTDEQVIKVINETSDTINDGTIVYIQSSLPSIVETNTIDNIEINVEPSEYVITINTKPTTIEELQISIFNNLDRVLSALSGH